MIEVTGLEMGYAMEEESVTVLSRVHLSIAAGDRVALVGPSGSGKTTLLLLLAGLEQPLGGTIELDGVALASLDADALADLRSAAVGIIFQSFHLVPSLTAVGNVALPLEIAGADHARERARDMLGRVGLAHRGRHFPMQLSGGEQQRVAIARALVHRPRLVLADEPTGNLDGRTGERIIELLFGLADDHATTLVLATHDHHIARRCSRVLHVAGGRLTEGTPHALPD